MRTSENALRMVMFFGQRPKAPETQVTFRGTGFAVVYKDDGFSFGYLVTARHVAEQVVPKGDIIARVNTPDGKSMEIEIDEIEWAFHPDPTVDVAITSLNLRGPDFELAYYNLADMVMPGSSPYRVQCGDPICIVGLFHWYTGAQKNKPVVHSGTIELQCCRTIQRSFR